MFTEIKQFKSVDTIFRQLFRGFLHKCMFIYYNLLMEGCTEVGVYNTLISRILCVCVGGGGVWHGINH